MYPEYQAVYSINIKNPNIPGLNNPDSKKIFAFQLFSIRHFQRTLHLKFVYNVIELFFNLSRLSSLKFLTDCIIRKCFFFAIGIFMNLSFNFHISNISHKT